MAKPAYTTIEGKLRLFDASKATKQGRCLDGSNRPVWRTASGVTLAENQNGSLVEYTDPWSPTATGGKLRSIPAASKFNSRRR